MQLVCWFVWLKQTLIQWREYDLLIMQIRINNNKSLSAGFQAFLQWKISPCKRWVDIRKKEILIPPKARLVRCYSMRDFPGSAHLDAELPAASVSQSNISELRNDEQIRVQAAMANACDQYVDNAPGVKEENLHLLFKPFFTTKPTGIGMGLAVSHSLIEANGGQLWIDPTEDSGATFHLTLPLAS